MSLQVRGLCFILLCYFLAASTNVIPENISSEEVEINKWSNLALHCNATEVPEGTVVWRREDSRNITLRNGELYETGVQVSSSIEGDPLNLSKIQREDKGVYICTASNGVDPSVRKRFIVEVNFTPEIKIPRTNRHINVELGVDVTFQFQVEAHPRGENAWLVHTGPYQGSEPGTPLVNSSKYVIEETQLNEYTTLMQLTVRNLGPADNILYRCTSRNPLGRHSAIRGLNYRPMHLQFDNSNMSRITT